MSFFRPELYAGLRYSRRSGESVRGAEYAEAIERPCACDRRSFLYYRRSWLVLMACGAFWAFLLWSVS